MMGFSLKNPLRNIFNFPEGKRILSAFSLLEDFVTQEMHRLFSPITDFLDLSSHFSRLHRRADYFLRVLNDEEGFSWVDKALIKKYSSLIKRQNVSLAEFCNRMMPALDKLQKKNNYEAFKELWSIFEFFRHNWDLSMDRLALVKQLGLDSEKDNQHDTFSLLHCLCCKNIWFHETLKEESCFIMLTTLIKASQVSNQEIDACIESLIDVIKTSINHEIDNIEFRLQNLPGDEDHVKSLRKMWEQKILSARINTFLPLIHHLEIRLQRCRNNPNDEIERALTLRDALNFIEERMSADKHSINAWLNNFRTILLQDEEKNAELLKIHRDILHLNSMQLEGFVAAVESIKALIGRCFIQMDLYTQKEDEKRAETFESQSLRAQKAGEELLKLDKISRKKKNGKQRTRNLQPNRVKEVKPQPIQPQKTLPSPKGFSVNYPQKTMAVEVKKVPVKRSTPLNQIESPFANLPETFASLSQCEINLTKLKQSQFASEDCWQYDQMQNLEYLLESLMETQVKEGFSVDLIFEQTDLLRRSVEALFGIATVFTDTSHDEVKSIGHDTEELFNILIKNTNVPENIRKLLWNMRNVPISLANANRCVNYPAKTKAQQDHLDDNSRQLINFLMDADQEGRAQTINKDLRRSLTEQLCRSLQRGVYFMERLLTAFLDPSKIVEGELPKEDAQKIDGNGISNNKSPSLESSTESHLLSEEAIEEKLKIISISNREEALSAIDTALVWIGIRCMAPVEGTIFLQWRTEERNIALRNSEIYLHRLKEKFGPERSSRPMSTILGQCQLMRRCQKELLIAALYHTDSFIDGQHIVEARDIRFANSPCFLMNILRNVSTCSKELPQIGHWMHRAHQILSYPASKEEFIGDFSASQLQNLLSEVLQASRLLRIVASDEILVLNSGKKTPEKRLQERIELVTANESQRIFPGLAAFLHTLKYGLSLPRHRHLTG